MLKLYVDVYTIWITKVHYRQYNTNSTALSHETDVAMYDTKKFMITQMLSFTYGCTIIINIHFCFKIEYAMLQIQKRLEVS